VAVLVKPWFIVLNVHKPLKRSLSICGVISIKKYLKALN
jgi:hypothetical protein